MERKEKALILMGPAFPIRLTMNSTTAKRSGEQDSLANENPNVADQPRVSAGQASGGQWTKEGLSGASQNKLTDEDRARLRKQNAWAVGAIAQFGDKGETPHTEQSTLTGPLNSGWDLKHQHPGLNAGDIALLESTRRNMARANTLMSQAARLSESKTAALQMHAVGVLADAMLKLAQTLAPFDGASALVTRSLLGAPATKINTEAPNPGRSTAARDTAAYPKAERETGSATETSDAPLAQVLQALKAGGQHPTRAQLEDLGKACDAWQKFLVSHGISPFVAGEQIQNIVHNFYNPGSGPNAGSEGVLGSQQGQSAGAGAGGIVAGAIVRASQSQRTADAPSQAPSASAAAKTLPGGSLQASEDAGGHLLDKHVGKTPGQLMSRAMTDPKTPGLASSFNDRATAEAAASQAIDANAGEITKWVESSETAPLKIYSTLNRSVGKIVTKEGVSTTTSSSVFYLVRDATSPTGYFIRTGYPTTR